MNNVLSLFIDVIGSDELVSHVKTMSRFSKIISAVNVDTLNSLNFSKQEKDLLVWDIRLIPCEEASLTLAKSLYNEVILIGIPEDDTIFDLINQLNITLFLRANHFKGELTNIFKLYTQKVSLRVEKSMLNKIFEDAQNSIVMTDINGNIQYANSYFENLSGYALDELIKDSPRIIKSGFHELSFYEDLWATVKSGNVWEGIFINLSKDKNIFFEEATITPISNEDGEITRFLKIGKNITRERLLLEELSNEVKLAISVLDMLLPSNVKNETLAFDYHMVHYNEIGGDFIYFKETNDHTYHFAMIDVMGHGVSSALIALTLAQMFEDYSQFQSLEHSVNALNQMLSKLNVENNDKAKYVTGVFIEINLLTQKCRIINTGHPDILIEHPDQTVSHISSNNMLLGVMPYETIQVEERPLSEVYKILTFTDGLFENNHVDYDKALHMLDESLVHLGDECFFESVMHAFTKSTIIEDDTTICKIVMNPQFLKSL